MKIDTTLALLVLALIGVVGLFVALGVAHGQTPTPVPIRDHILTEAGNRPAEFTGRLLVAVADDVPTARLRSVVRRIGVELSKIDHVNGPDFSGMYDDFGIVGKTVMLKSAQRQRARRRVRADARAAEALANEDEVTIP